MATATTSSVLMTDLDNKDASFFVTYDEQKGRQIISKRTYQTSEIILQEKPLVCSQFEWNKLYKYSACEYCLHSLESCENNVRRLCQDQTINIPYPENDPNRNVEQTIVRCGKCNELYCSSTCYELACESYHKILCKNTLETNNERIILISKIQDLWRSVHPPPETSSISLVLKMMAMLRQTTDRQDLLRRFQQFSQGVQSTNQKFYHKLLRKEFEPQVEQLRTCLQKLNDDHLKIDEFKWFLTANGFRQLLALLGRNQQGIGTSSLAVWVKNCENIHEHNLKHDEISQMIDAIYTKIDEVSGDFIDCEGSGLFQLQSCLNHSCDANAEIQYLHNNSQLSVVATKTISMGEEITINYLSECDRNRSKHSRQKILLENYLFICQCNRCLAESNQADETSDEEEEENVDDNNNSESNVEMED